MSRHPKLLPTTMPNNVQRKLDELIAYMVRSGKYNDQMVGRAKRLVHELQARGVHCVDRFVQRLLGGVRNKEEYLDILVEGRFALVLVRNGFSEIHIEYSRQGPDLKANYNRQTIYFEVRRRRPKQGESWEVQGSRFVGEDTEENIIDIIRRKRGQFRDGKLNILVLWSDTVELAPSTIREAVPDMFKQNSSEFQIISGVLFTESEGYSLPSVTQYHFHRNPHASKPVGIRLTRKLGSLHTRSPKALRRESEDLLARVQRRP